MSSRGSQSWQDTKRFTKIPTSLFLIVKHAKKYLQRNISLVSILEEYIGKVLSVQIVRVFTHLDIT